MKKNLLSIIILALLVVNIVLTSIMMFSVTSASNKTTALVNNIAAVLNLEVSDVPKPGEEPKEEVIPIENVQTYDVVDKMTIPLRKDPDGTAHYALLKVSFLMNTKNDGFKKYGADIASKESMLKDTVIEVIASHTIDEIENNNEEIKKEIVDNVQKMFGSDFIYGVAFSDVTYQ